VEGKGKENEKTGKGEEERAIFPTMNPGSATEPLLHN